MSRYLPSLGTAICGLFVMLGAVFDAHIYRWEVFVWGFIIITLSITVMLYVKVNRTYESLHR